MQKPKNKQIFLSPPWTDASELKSVGRAFASGYIAPCGPQVDEFERRIAALAGRKYAVALSSGTAAMELALAELGVDRHWTVVAPTLTFIATVGPAFHRGAKLVFVDSEATGLVDLRLLEKALKSVAAKAPRVIFVGVDLYGRCADFRAIRRLCRRYGVHYLSDSAESVGAETGGRPSGSGAEMVIYSFNGNKIITTSGGGMLLSDDRAIVDCARKRSQQSREACPWYEHREVGWNYRMSNIVAAVGLAQLEKLPVILERRARTAAWYREHTREIGEMLPAVPGENNWLNVLLLENAARRDRLIELCREARVEARPVWKPMHLQPAFSKCRVFGGAVAASLFERGVCLPSGTELTPAILKARLLPCFQALAAERKGR